MSWPAASWLTGEFELVVSGARPQGASRVAGVLDPHWPCRTRPGMAGLRPPPWALDAPQTGRTIQSVTTSSPEPPVLIVGAGPTGLVLALWLTRLGMPVRIVDKTAEPEPPHARWRCRRARSSFTVRSVSRMCRHHRSGLQGRDEPRRDRAAHATEPRTAPRPAAVRARSDPAFHVPHDLADGRTLSRKQPERGERRHHPGRRPPAVGAAGLGGRRGQLHAFDVARVADPRLRRRPSRDQRDLQRERIAAPRSRGDRRSSEPA